MFVLFPFSSCVSTSDVSVKSGKAPDKGSSAEKQSDKGVNQRVSGKSIMLTYRHHQERLFNAFLSRYVDVYEKCRIEFCSGIGDEFVKKKNVYEMNF